jgi:hypothetical protein
VHTSLDSKTLLSSISGLCAVPALGTIKFEFREVLQTDRLV